MPNTDNLRQTSLYDTHVSLGARIVPFGGWAMPVQYDSILREARAVRSNVGLFDVSHMGRLKIQGSGAARLLSRVLSVGAISMRPTRARYCLICNEDGGIIDDCIVYRNGEEDFLLVPNASNTASRNRVARPMEHTAGHGRHHEHHGGYGNDSGARSASDTDAEQHHTRTTYRTCLPFNTDTNADRRRGSDAGAHRLTRAKTASR